MGKEKRDLKLSADPFWTKEHASDFDTDIIIDKLVYLSIIGLDKAMETVQSIVLTDSLQRIEYELEDFIIKLGYYFPNLKHISVSEKLFKSMNLFSADGCLYVEENGFFILLHCPAGRTGVYSILEGTNRVERYAFSCSQLEEVLFPDSLTEIDEEAFDSSQIVRLHIPETIKLIGDQGCENPAPNCPNLTSITVDPNHKKYYAVDNCLFSKKDRLLLCYPAGLEASHYSLPAKCRDIGFRAFDGTLHLETVSLHSKLSRIGYAAFTRASIKKIDLPDSIDYIGEQAFEECNSLQTVIVRNDNARIEGGDFGSFRKCSNGLRIVANAGSTGEKYAHEMGFAFLDLTAYD